MSESSVATRLFRKLLGLGVVYVVLQIVVGVEVSFVIVYLHLAQQMSIPGATMTAMPVGLPLLLAQGALYLAYRRGWFGRIYRKLRRLPEDPPTVGRAAPTS